MDPTLKLVSVSVASALLTFSLTKLLLKSSETHFKKLIADNVDEIPMSPTVSTTIENSPNSNEVEVESSSVSIESPFSSAEIPVPANTTGIGSSIEETAGEVRNVESKVVAENSGLFSEGDNEIQRLKDELDRCNKTLLAERAGRTKAERQLRHLLLNGTLSEEDPSASSVLNSVSIQKAGYHCLPIGHIKSPFVGRRGTPRQGMLVPDGRAHIVMMPGINFNSLDGLIDYSHVYVIFQFNENTNEHKKRSVHRNMSKGAMPSSFLPGSPLFNANNELMERPWRPLVEAPALHGHSVGVFGSRSPHRPNAIGLSLCRLVAVHAPIKGKKIIVLSGCDLLEGTPVLDIKPYAPFDCPRCLGDLVSHDDVITASRVGLSSCNSGNVSTAGFNECDANNRKPWWRRSYSTPSNIKGAIQSLALSDDIPASPFHVRVPRWVLSGLRKHPQPRLPVVWLSEPLRSARNACLSGEVKFYGSNARKFIESTEVNLPPHRLSSVGMFSQMLKGQHTPDCDSEELVSPDVDSREVEVNHLIRAITQTLSLDIRTVRHGRGSAQVINASTIPNGSSENSPLIDDIFEDIEDESEEAREQRYLALIAKRKASFTSSQWYEMQFDRLHIQFTFREIPSELIPTNADIEKAISSNEMIESPIVTESDFVLSLKDEKVQERQEKLATPKSNLRASLTQTEGLGVYVRIECVSLLSPGVNLRDASFQKSEAIIQEVNSEK